MTVRHLTGTLDIVDGNVVAKMSGVRGFFKKEQWSREQVLPISRLASVHKTTDDKGRVTLSFQAKYGDVPDAFLNCVDRDDIQTLLENLSRYIVVEADGVIWQVHQANIQAGTPQMVPGPASSVGPTPSKTCSNCGAPFAVTPDGRCIHCRAVLAG